MTKLERINSIIQKTTDKNLLKLLNKAWWREYLNMKKLKEGYVVVKPNNAGVFMETFSKTPEAAWDEFYLAGVCEDAIDKKVNCIKKGYDAKKVAVVILED